MIVISRHILSIVLDIVDIYSKKYIYFLAQIGMFFLALYSLTPETKISAVSEFLSIANIMWRQIACKDNCLWLTPNSQGLFQRTISCSRGVKQELYTLCKHSAAAMCDASEAALMAGND
jgi:hypothetical protein